METYSEFGTYVYRYEKLPLGIVLSTDCGPTEPVPAPVKEVTSKLYSV